VSRQTQIPLLLNQFLTSQFPSLVPRPVVISSKDTWLRSKLSKSLDIQIMTVRIITVNNRYFHPPFNFDHLPSWGPHMLMQIEFFYHSPRWWFYYSREKKGEGRARGKSVTLELKSLGRLFEDLLFMRDSRTPFSCGHPLAYCRGATQEFLCDPSSGTQPVFRNRTVLDVSLSPALHSSSAFFFRHGPTMLTLFRHGPHDACLLSFLLF
jgi:hypothetical protein